MISKADSGRIKANLDSCHGPCGCSLSPVPVQTERMLANGSKLPSLFLTPGGIFAKSMGQKPSPAWCHNAQNKSRCPASLLLTAVLGPTGILLLGPLHSPATHFCFPAGCCAICRLLKGCPAAHRAQQAGSIANTRESVEKIS